MSDHDLPTQGVLQSMNARAVSGEHLEVLGKRASALWLEGREKSLNSAVVSTVKTAGLSPEQVKRVVEFANTSAYLAEFHKEGSLNRVVDFGAGGLADPSTVLQDLNDGGGGSTYDTGSLEYNHPPPQTKTASVEEEESFAQMFASSGHSYPEVSPLGEAIDLRDKIAGAYETTTSMLSSLEVAFDDLQGRVFHQVKQAALNGHSLAEVAQIWQQNAPSDEHVKVAFQAVMNPLVDNGVFSDHEAVAESLSKHASIGTVDPTHPLVVDFKDFCDVLTKLAEARSAQQELGEASAQLFHFIKNAGALSEVAGGVNRAGNYVGKAVEGLTNSEALGAVAGVGTKALPAYAAYEVYRRNLKYHPATQKVKGELAQMLPNSEARDRKDAELQARYYGGY